jgi:ribosomal protein S18 acetylase RimI-like enzyme
MLLLPSRAYPRELTTGIKMPHAGSIFGHSQVPIDYWRGYILNPAHVEIRRLTSADVTAYRDIRLAGLRHNPEAFGSTFIRESTQPLTWFCDRLSNSAVFGAFQSAALLGVAGLAIREGEKERHKGLLWGMYVRPDARKTGVGRQLVEAVIDHARAHVEVIQLSVISDNEPARRLYSGLGFVEYGLEKDSLKQNGRYYDEILMALDLRLDLDQYALPTTHTGATFSEELTPSSAE